eukprot:1726477-Pyramimonas_sp.AAC.2
MVIPSPVSSIPRRALYLPAGGWRLAVLVAPAVFVDSPLAGAPLSTYLDLLYTRSMLLIPGGTPVNK